MSDKVEAANRWMPGMASPNPKGRPKGIVDRRNRVATALNGEGDRIVRAVIDAALNGDMQAAGLVLARISPPLKARAEIVKFDLSQDRPLAEQAKQVMGAVAAGDVDPETGRVLITCLQSVAGITAVQELEQRLIALDEKR